MIILFIILMIAVFGRLLGFAFKAAWGVTKVVFGLIFLPVLLIGLVIAGFVYVALPILAIVGIVLLVKSLVVTAV
ncbi:MAG: hypothetical protein IK071_05245 [Lachnospiraceae bacterium]|nr:hypothetical protein [Lachnospiraceae bacterium]